MNYPPPIPKYRNPRQRDYARRVHQAIASATPQPIGNVYAITPNGTLYRPPPHAPPAAGGEAEQFYVLNEYQNHLVGVRITCDLVADSSGRIFDKDAEVIGINGASISDSEKVRIMKPPEMRANLFDVNARGGTVVGDVDGLRFEFSASVPNQRTVTMVDASAYGADTISWSETIDPPYTLTLPEGSSETPVRKIICAMKIKQRPIARVAEGAETFDVDYVDMNVAGRRYEPNYRKVPVCVRVQGSPVVFYVLLRASDTFQEI